jgi:choline dehydrogenase
MASFDYIVIGAGTAGCVLAARLSLDPGVTVALVELGGMDTNPAIYSPGLGPLTTLWSPQGAENWGYATTPQAGLGNRSIDIARGRVLGGSSAINAMIYIRGNPRDFDEWAALGNPGWSYQDVLPYFRKSETYHGPLSAWRGDNGPVSVIDYQKPSEVSHAFVEAAATLGATRRYNDFNGAIQEAGAGFYQSTRTLDGVRVTAASAFIKPILGRPNLRLLSGLRATHLVFDKDRVSGVEVSGPDGRQTLQVERELALCCGTFETPKLMMLSGLGPADQLAAHGITVIRDLPEVGRNLQDHMLLGVGYESRVPLDPPALLAEGGLFTSTPDAGPHAIPNLQYFFGPVQFIAQEYMTSGPGFTFAPILSRPRSRGSVTLSSSDPATLAQVDPCYLSEAEDLAVLEHGIRYARELAQTSAFNGLRGRELAPGESANTATELQAYIRRNAGTVWHPAGTCRMGRDGEAVVDEQLRVRGIEGLRIVDASVMPRLVNGNPNAAIMMIAERAADLMRTGAAAAPRAPAAGAPA